MSLLVSRIGALPVRYRALTSFCNTCEGENLQLPIVGSMLKRCGAFFIRRSFADDALYPVIVRGESLRYPLFPHLNR